MSEYVNRESVEEALFAKWEKERQRWIEYLKQYRATKEYSSKEQTAYIWRCGYGKAVDDFLAILENTPAADVVPVVTDTNVGGKWIPVTERLPESDARVLVYMHENRMSYTRIDTDRVVQGKWVRWETCVSHWMPLPLPPESEV